MKATDTYHLPLVLVVVWAVLPQSWAYLTFTGVIPNGRNVPHPCIEGQPWLGVGHLDPRGGGARNVFGKDFKSIGNTQWTVRLCQMDSDGDGLTNGEELGDPECKWVIGATPSRTTGISHPGICTPHKDAKCAGRDTFVSCTMPKPPGKLECDNLNRTGLFIRDYLIPRTKIPPRETTYVCYTFNVPTLEDFYMIGMEPLIDNKEIVHHMIIYGCPDTVPITDEPVDCIMGTNCDDIIGLWGMGHPGTCLPDNVGFLVGKSGYKKIQIEYHWHNVRLHDDLFDASGMRLYYERKSSRPNMIAAGVFMTGQMLLKIPPGKDRHVHTGGCPEECTAMFWKGNLTLFGGANHMHYIGVAQKTELWRDGKRIHDLGYDNPASFDNPIYRSYEKTITMYPGDRLHTECVYDSSNRQWTTYYGPGIKDEMCFFFAFYYPKDMTPERYCNYKGPISACHRYQRLPYAGCDWANFVKGIEAESSPIAQQVRRNCIMMGECQPECRTVVNDLRKHPCMSQDMILFMTTHLDDTLAGSQFLARVSSCLDDCPTSSTYGPRSGAPTSVYFLQVTSLIACFISLVVHHKLV